MKFINLNFIRVVSGQGIKKWSGRKAENNLCSSRLSSLQSVKNLLFTFVFSKNPPRHNYKTPFAASAAAVGTAVELGIGGWNATLDGIPWSAGLSFKNHYAPSTRLYTCDIKYYAYTLFMYMYICIRYTYFFFSFFPPFVYVCVCVWMCIYQLTVFSLNPDEVRNIVKYMKNRYT